MGGILSLWLLLRQVVNMAFSGTSYTFDRSFRVFGDSFTLAGSVSISTTAAAEQVHTSTDDLLAAVVAFAEQEFAEKTASATYSVAYASGCYANIAVTLTRL
jgi:hypothetical protein